MPDKPLHNLIVLGTGLILILVPLALAIFAPDAYGQTQQFLRIIAALGGGLIGSLIPGYLKVTFPGVDALGGMAVFALVLMYDPLWRVEAAIEVLAETPDRSGSETMVASTGEPAMSSITADSLITTKLQDCIATMVNEYQTPKEKAVVGGARARGPGIGGGRNTAQEEVCLSFGPHQEFISAATATVSCHGGRCSVTAPEFKDNKVCVTAAAWSESKSFGGGGSGQYRLAAQYRDVATDDVRSGFLADCRGTTEEATF